MKQKKRFLCGNNGNTQLPKNKTVKKQTPYFNDYQRQTLVQKFAHPFCSLHDFYVF